MLSRLPVPATEHGISGDIRITMPDDIGISTSSEVSRAAPHLDNHHPALVWMGNVPAATPPRWNKHPSLTPNLELREDRH